MPFFLALFLLLSCLGCGPAAGAGLSDAFFEAEACARELRKSSQQIKLRSNWTAVHRQVPDGLPSGPKGPLGARQPVPFRDALHGAVPEFRSEADQKAAAELFEQLQKKFPDSGYRDRAAAELQKLNAHRRRLKDEAARQGDPAGKPVPVAKGRKQTKRGRRGQGIGAPRPAAGAAKIYCTRRRRAFGSCAASQPTESTRREWMLCIGRFHNAYLEDPAGPLGRRRRSIMEGVLYQDLHKGLKFDSDLRAARENFEKIVKEYPGEPIRRQGRPGAPVHALRAGPRPQRWPAGPSAAGGPSPARDRRAGSAGNRGRASPGAGAGRGGAGGRRRTCGTGPTPTTPGSWSTSTAKRNSPTGC
ncbi:MAG: tetratricopeptide repeat protein [Desulfobacterales bacterium]|nr:tetratricopeptide repeat protein [Desulfobacterales bacterium]